MGSIEGRFCVRHLQAPMGNDLTHFNVHTIHIVRLADLIHADVRHLITETNEYFSEEQSWLYAA